MQLGHADLDCTAVCGVSPVQDADQSVKNAVTTSISNTGVLTVGTSEASGVLLLAPVSQPALQEAAFPAAHYMPLEPSSQSPAQQVGVR